MLIAAVIVTGIGIFSFRNLSMDAVPDITNVQVQVNTLVEGLPPLEIERQVTYPIETAMAGLPGLAETRSLSRYGLSQVTVVFRDGTNIYFARQLVNERLQDARESLPRGIAEPRVAQQRRHQDGQRVPVATLRGEVP